MRYLSCTAPATHSEWSDARRFFGPDGTYVLYALEELTKRGGTWTVGDDVLVYNTTGTDPRPYLRLLTLAKLARVVDVDTWEVTPTGAALDHGRTALVDA